MTIFPDTVGTLFDDVMHIYSLGFLRVEAFFAFGANWSGHCLSETISIELKKLADFYLLNRRFNVPNLFDIPLHFLIKKKTHIEKWCGTGTNLVSICCSGKRYPCQTFQPNSTETPLPLDKVDFSSAETLRDPECANCFLEAICPNCYGINYAKHGDVRIRNKDVCAITKARVLAACYLTAKRIGKGALSMSPRELYQTIRAIQLVQRAFAT